MTHEEPPVWGSMPADDWRPEAPAATEHACFRHPGRPALARCVRCGRLACDLCRVLSGGRNCCRACASETTGAGDPPYRPYAAELPAQGIPGERHAPVFKDAPWGVGEAAIIFVAAAALAVAIGFLANLGLSRFASPLASRILLIFLSSSLLYTFLLAGTFYSVKVRHRSSLSAVGIRLDNPGRGLLLGVGLGVPLFIGAVGIAYVLQMLVEPTGTDYLSESMESVASRELGVGLIVLLIFTLVVLAPVCEEIFFRGYLYPALRNMMGMQPAMVLNGIIFAAAHLEILGLLPRMLLGYGLSYMYDRSRNLVAPIVGHALYNGLLVLLVVLFSLF